MSQFEARLGCMADNEQLQQLFSVPQPSLGIQLAFERAPNYFHSEAVMYNSGELWLVIHSETRRLAAAVNIGHRWLYVNGVAQWVRYGADMRIAPEFQGSRALLYINRAVKHALADDYYLSIILQDNNRSKESFEHARAGLPSYRKLGEITTYTLHSPRFLRYKKPPVRVATDADIPAMNEFIKKMANYYQFLPCYDFELLKTNSDFFQGLTINDFLLLEKDGKICGLVGLWDQKQIKQTKVVSYSNWLKIARPFYNLWSSIFGGIKLPQKGGNLAYLTLHSPLTEPCDLAGFEQLLNAAWKAAKARGFSSIIFTLANEDPRNVSLENYRYNAIHSNHYSVDYNEENQANISTNYIYYYECGRN